MHHHTMARADGTATARTVHHTVSLVLSIVQELFSITMYIAIRSMISTSVPAAAAACRARCGGLEILGSLVVKVAAYKAMRGSLYFSAMSKCLRTVLELAALRARELFEMRWTHSHSSERPLRPLFIPTLGHHVSHFITLAWPPSPKLNNQIHQPVLCGMSAICTLWQASEGQSAMVGQ